MATSNSPPREELGAAGGADFVEDEEANFDTPPESPDDVRLELSPDVQEELNQLESTEEYIKKNQEWIARSAESVRELKVTMEKLIGQTSSRKSELENRTQKIKQMKKEIDEISAEAIEKEEQELKRLIDVERHNKDVNGESEADIANEQTLANLLLKVEAYREHLGLQINNSQDGIEFLFTDVDGHSPNSTYSLKLTLDRDNYKCISCEPPVEKIEELFEQLNTHHDLQKFMTSLRSEFQALVNKEN